MYSIQHYMIKFVSDLRQFDIAEILLKVALNTITLNHIKAISTRSFIIVRYDVQSQRYL